MTTRMTTNDHIAALAERAQAAVASIRSATILPNVFVRADA